MQTATNLITRGLSQSLFVLIHFFFVNAALGAVDPAISWRVLRTQNFEVIHDAQSHELALAYARSAERAHLLLGPLFNNKTPKRTVIFLDDSTDSANGFATAVPRPTIGVYPVLPDSMDFLSHYGDWSQEMITHEYTHILNIEPAEGLWAPFRFLLGNIIRPNALLPRWYLEGLAVQNESQYTQHGRLRSPLYQAIIRSQLLDATWGSEDLGRVNDTTIPTWPLGSRPYFFGALFWNHLVQEKGEGSIGLLNDRYAARVPYFLNGAAREEFSRNMDELLEDTYSRFGGVAKEQIGALSTKSTTDAEAAFPELKHGFNQHSPRINPQGDKLIFVHRTLEDDDQIFLAERGENKSFKTPIKILGGLKSVSRLTWLPDGKQFIYDNQATWNRYYTFNDLYLYDLEKKKAKRLTKGLRSKEVAVSPDGSQIVFVVNGPSQTRLLTAAISGEDVKTVYSPALQVRLSSPEFVSPESIVFVERDINGIETVREFDLKSGKTQTKLNTMVSISGLHRVKDGFVFQSSKTGVGNLYLASVDWKSIRPLTHSRTHIFSGTFDSDTKKILASRLTSDGGRLEETTASEGSLPQIENTAGYGWKTFSEPQLPGISGETEAYSSTSYLLPQYWLPILFSGAYGTAFGASIASQDPLQKQAYSLSGTYDSRTKRPNWGGAYLNNMTPLQLRLTGSDSFTYVESLRKRLHEQAISPLAGFYLYGLSNDWRGLAGWSYYSSEYEGESAEILQGPSLGVSYNNLSQKGYQISPMKGFTGQALHTHYLPKIGNVSYTRSSGTLAWFFSNWLPDFHALRTQVSGSYTPRQDSLLTGTTTGGGEYASSYVNVPNIVRGYAPGAFLGWSFLTTSMEYRFPVEYLYRGWGTSPWFLKRTHGALFWDSLSTDGAYYDLESSRSERTHFGRFFSGVGAELRFDLTLFYHAPVTLRLGYHYGLVEKALGGPGFFVGFLLPEY